MEIDANLLIQELKAQRNAAIDEAAFAKAQVQHLIKKSTALEERVGDLTKELADLKLRAGE